MVAQYALAGTGALWFIGGVFVGANLGILFAAMARVAGDWE